MTNEEIIKAAEALNARFAVVAKSILALRDEIAKVAADVGIPTGLNVNDVIFCGPHGEQYTALQVLAGRQMDDAMDKLSRAYASIDGIGGAQAEAINALAAIAKEVRNA